MNIGFIGLGKLGLPVSVAMCNNSDSYIFAYDSDERKLMDYRSGICSLHEPDISKHLNKALSSNRYQIYSSVEDILSVNPEIVFVAVPTPTTGLDDDRFDLTYIEKVMEEIASIKKAPPYPVIAIISTLLPGDMRKKLRYNLPFLFPLIYNPSFIAMGTTMEDFLNPEFVLIGDQLGFAGKVVETFYREIYGDTVPYLHMSWDEAEVTKQAYNTLIGFKIVFANTLMELCHKLGNANVDVVSNALGKATKRITSDKYLRGGLGDSGYCHPRDQNALSDVAKELRLSVNPFEYIMESRLKQSKWIASHLLKTGLPIVIMGIRYKPNTNLTGYSASDLVRRTLGLFEEFNVEAVMIDPMFSDTDVKVNYPAAFLIGHLYDFIHDLSYYPEGSVIVDPWRCFTEDEIKELCKHEVCYMPIGVS